MSEEREKIVDFEYFTTVDLSLPEVQGQKSSYHFVYASELYGTIFAIYARFERTKDNIGDNNVYKIGKILLELVNYKGPINIGFANEPMTWNGKNLGFIVQGTSTKTSHFLSLEVAPHAPIQIQKGIRDSIFFNRILRPLPGFEGYLQNRKGSTDARKLTGEPPVIGLFDSEFNDRDGIDFYDRQLKPGMEKHPENPMVIVGYRCITGSVNLLF